jgi:hypothetical protein
MGLFGYTIDPTQNPQGGNMLTQAPQQPQVNTTPFSGILPGDTYTPPQQPTNPKFPGTSPNTNPFPVPNMPKVVDSGFNFFTQNGQQSGNQSQTGTSTGGQGQLGPNIDTSKGYSNVKTASGLEAAIKHPPKNYDEAGGYQQYIDAWNQWYAAVRQALGLGANWSQEDIDKLKPLFEQMGIKYQAKPGEKWSSRIYIPDGRGGYIQIDTRGGQGESGWVNYGHTEQSGAYANGGNGRGGSSSGSSGGTSSGGSSSGTSGSYTAGPWDQRANDLYNTLLGRANQSLDINRQDPIIRAQANAFSAAQNRAARNYMADTAERGGPYFNMQGERRMAAEKVGQATSAFEASLMQSELTARREEIAQALQMMGSLLTTEQQLALTRELGYLDAAIRKLGIEMQNNQFFARLGFDVEDRASVLDLMRRGLA